MKIFCKLIFVIVFIVKLFTSSANAQIAITVTNPTNTTPNLSASYTSLANAINAINAITGMTGPVTFSLAAGGTETAPAGGYLLGNATLNALTSSTNTITFNKSGINVNPLITAFTPGTSTTVDGIWKIAGTDYVTISNIDLQESAGNTTPTQQMEWGYAIVKLNATDGSQNININNCTVTLNKANTASKGIYGGNHIATSVTALTITTAAGTNANIKINGNTVTNCYVPISINGFTTLAGYDTGLEIGTTTGNTISNYGGGSVTAIGIYINGQNTSKIENNTVTLGAGTTAIAYGINVAAACIGDLKINANTVSVTSSSTTQILAAILNSAPIATALDITNNVIRNCNYATATAGSFYGIQEAAATTGCTVNITGNTVSGTVYSNADLAGSGSIIAIFKSGGTPTTVNANNNTVNGNTMTGTTGGIFYGINIGAGTNQNINSNNIYNNTISGTGTGGTLYGIKSTGAGGTIVHNLNNIYNNQITKSTSAGTILGFYNASTPTSETYTNNNIYGLSSAGINNVYGINASPSSAVTRTVSGNKIYSLSSAGGTVYGMYQLLSSPNIFQNKIYDLSSTTSTGLVYGIYINTGTTVNIYNNLIGDLRTPDANTSATVVPLAGIYLAGGTTNNVYYNTVYLNASSTGALFGSAAIYTLTTATLDLRNNIFVNTSTPTGTGITAAYRRNTITLTTYASTSNNNLFYAGTPGAKNVIFYNGTAVYQTLAAYKTLVGPTRDAASITELPNFVSTTGSDGTFLHINTTIATQIESGGANIAAYTDDYDGNIRQGNPGYVGTGTAPDIGADEFELSLLTPVLLSPANNSVNNPTSLNLVWSKPQSATLYNAVLATDSLFTNIIINDSTLTDSIKAVSGLSNYTTYYWKVRAKSITEWSSYSSIWNFTTIIPIPAVPTLLTPANNSVDLSLTPTLDWNDVTYAASYRVQVSNSSFTIIFDTVVTVSQLTVVQGHLTTNSQYYWTVSASNTSGTSGFVFPAWGFTTAPNAPNVPVLSSPLNGSTNQPTTLTFKWFKAIETFNNKTKTISKYCFEYSTDPAFAAGVIADSSLTDTIKVLAGLNNFTQYYWRVKAKNQTGWGTYSSVWNFTTIVGSPGAPTLLSPLNNAVGQPLALSLVWNKITSATLYHVQLSTDPGFGSFVVNDSTLTDTTKALTNLNTLTSYYWRVRSFNISGWSSFGSSWTFKTIGTASQVILANPVNGSINQPLAFTFNWFKAVDMTNMFTGQSGQQTTNNGQLSTNLTVSNYWFEYGQDSTFATVLERDSSLTDTTKVLAGLDNLTQYYWRVKAKNQTGWGTFSSIWSFTTIALTPVAPTLSTPVNGATGISLTPAVTWNAVSGAVSYRFQISTDSLFATTNWDTAGVTITSANVPAGKLTGLTKYYWRVNATNAGGTSPWSLIWNFRTLQILPVTLKIYLEGFWNGTTQITDTAKLYLANSTTPFALVDSAMVILSSTGTATPTFTKVVNGNYYIVVKHRNHLETWSKLPQSFVTGVTVNYDFTTAATQAFGDNMKQVGSVWVLFGGDANQDGEVGANDIPIFITQFGTQGYLSCDFNGDGDVNGIDVPIFRSNFGLTKAVPTLFDNPNKGKKNTEEIMIKKTNTDVKTNTNLKTNKETKKNI